MTSTAADFFAKTAERRIVPIKGLEPWGLTLFMRSMTAGEKSDFEKSMLDDDLNKVDDERLRTSKARLAIACVCDESGRPMFSADDLERIEKLDAKVIEVIYSQLNAHVGFDRGDLESLVKNSGAVRAACSPTNSR